MMHMQVGIYYSSLKIAQEYIYAKKTIMIWILGFNLFKDGDYHEIGRTRRDSNNEIISENIESHFIQLPRFLEQVQEIKNKEEQWLAYISGNLNKEEKEELFKMNRDIKEIDKIVDIVLTDEDVQNELFYRVMDKNLEDLKKQRAFEEGEEKGKEEGEYEKAIAIAKEMVKNGEDIEKIALYTGLTKEEIEKL